MSPNKPPPVPGAKGPAKGSAPRSRAASSPGGSGASQAGNQAKQGKAGSAERQAGEEEFSAEPSLTPLAKVALKKRPPKRSRRMIKEIMRPGAQIHPMREYSAEPEITPITGAPLGKRPPVRHAGPPKPEGVVVEFSTEPRLTPVRPLRLKTVPSAGSQERKAAPLSPSASGMKAALKKGGEAKPAAVKPAAIKPILKPRPLGEKHASEPGSTPEAEKPAPGSPKPQPAKPVPAAPDSFAPKPAGVAAPASTAAIQETPGTPAPAAAPAVPESPALPIVEGQSLPVRAAPGIPPKASDDTSSAVDASRVIQFGRYELLLEMGKGGMATLFLSKIRSIEGFEKILAIKKIHDHLTEEAEFINMFLDEARLAARIHHPNVAQIFDMGQIEGSYYISMEYVHGQNLADILKISSRTGIMMDWTLAARIVANTAAGLHAAHELRNAKGEFMGVVHRDVSPHNIILSFDGHVKVVDFGIAYAAERITHTELGTMKGRGPYMSPEQARGDPLDRRSDIFSLGTILFEAVTVKRLFKTDSDAATLELVKRADVPRLTELRPGTPVDLERICRKALNRDRDKRYQNAAALERDLEELLINHRARVGHQELTKFMDKLFYDRKQIRDEQIRHVLEYQGEGVQKALGVHQLTEAMHVASEDSDQGVVKAARRSNTVAVGVAAGSLLFAAFLLFFFLIYRGPTEDRGKRSGRDTVAANKVDAAVRRSTPPMPPMPIIIEPMVPASARDAQVTKRPAKVRIQIAVKPAGVRSVVVFRGRRYRTSSFKSPPISPESISERITISARGYHSKNLDLVPDKDLVLEVTLKRRTRTTTGMSMLYGLD